LNLKNSLASFLGEKLRVTENHGRCVVTLPIETVDKRRVSVIVEHMGETFIVHDGGKTMSEPLFCHGVSMSDTRMEQQASIAKAHGAHIANKMIRVVCKLSDLETAIFAVAECSSMSMLDLVGHRPKFDEDSVPLRVVSILDDWKPDGFRIDKNVTIRTADSDHKLTALCSGNGITIAVKVLGSDTPQKNAQQYAYLGVDLAQNSDYQRWQRFAVVSGSEKRSKPALSLVRKYSAEVLPINSEHEEEGFRLIPSIMDGLLGGNSRYIQ
jgi:hypothetical protein